jgi:prolyl-tRNA editing enzyme YbaK/EbsC (Cys-tRNA(Pro) deacylase)
MPLIRSNEARKAAAMKSALDLHRELLGKDVPHEIIRLPRVVLHADEIPDVLGVPQDQCVTVRVYVSGRRMVAVAVPAGRHPLPTALADCIPGGSALRPATPQEVNEATDYAAGLVAPLLLPVPLYADARLGSHAVLYTATGDTGTALGIATADLLVSSGARVAALTTPSLAEVGVDLEV